ncbi:MAG: response regulator [Alphaproteobacteria bacterium]|nr:response regulator [Alphaproteobacteria bacterium]MBT7942705.1 response regulator [Alphaproteobacteria bacterium]
MAEIHQPNLIFMDINLPGMNGFQALERLKASKTTRNIPVVALTALASARDKDHGLQLGFEFYLTKPFKVEEISVLLQRSLQ